MGTGFIQRGKGFVVPAVQPKVVRQQHGCLGNEGMMLLRQVVCIGVSEQGDGGLQVLHLLCSGQIVSRAQHDAHVQLC